MCGGAVQTGATQAGGGNQGAGPHGGPPQRCGPQPHAHHAPGGREPQEATDGLH